MGFLSKIKALKDDALKEYKETRQIKKKTKADEKAIYQKAYTSARKQAIKETARIKARTIVDKAKEDAKHGGRFKRGLKSVSSHLQEVKKRNQKQGGGTLPMFR